MNFTNEGIFTLTIKITGKGYLYSVADVLTAIGQESLICHHDGTVECGPDMVGYWEGKEPEIKQNKLAPLVRRVPKPPEECANNCGTMLDEKDLYCPVCDPDF